MLAVALAFSSSLCWGLADFLGGWQGRGARRGGSGRNVRDAVERAESVLRGHRARQAHGTDDEDAIESLVSALQPYFAQFSVSRRR